MDEQPKVLVGTPTYQGKDYCLEEYMENITSLDYDNYDVIIVDNTDDGGKYCDETLKPYDDEKVSVKHVNRGKNSQEAIANAMNTIYTEFVNGDYEYLLVVESDLFPKSDVINRLLSYGQPVVGSYYILGFEDDDELMRLFYHDWKSGVISEEYYQYLSINIQFQRACIFLNDEKEDGMWGTRGLDPEESLDYVNTGLRQVHGCGLGCTLIDRRTLEKVGGFWYPDGMRKQPDVMFYLDCQVNLIPVFVDTDYIVEHHPSRWEMVEDWQKL